MACSMFSRPLCLTGIFCFVLLIRSADAFVACWQLHGRVTSSSSWSSWSSWSPLWSLSSHRRRVSSTHLWLAAAKRKRRRKDEDSGDSASADLPDFDLNEEQDEPAADAAPKPKKRSSSSSATSSSSSTAQAFSELEVTPAMMGSNFNKPVKSVRELLTDRTLERKLEFDNEEAVATDPSGALIPDLTQLARQQQQQQQQEQQVNDKRARQAARRAELAAQQGNEKEEETESILSKLPVQITNEEGKVEPLKLLEAGTWLGIVLLIAWEIYLNSPFFERAAPMAPIVYQFFM